MADLPRTGRGVTLVLWVLAVILIAVFTVGGFWSILVGAILVGLLLAVAYLLVRGVGERLLRFFRGGPG